MEIEMCGKCGKEPVYIVKRKLCKKCYADFGRAARKNNGSIKNLPDWEYKTESKIRKSHFKPVSTKNELEFVKNYFNHSDWTAFPATFRLGGINYTPDFYDIRRNVFIEVVGTRQSYHQNKHKHELFQKNFPKLTLEIRTVDGDLLGEKQFGEMWSAQYENSHSS